MKPSVLLKIKRLKKIDCTCLIYDNIKKLEASIKRCFGKSAVFLSDTNLKKALGFFRNSMWIGLCGYFRYINIYLSDFTY